MGIAASNTCAIFSPKNAAAPENKIAIMMPTKIERNVISAIGLPAETIG